MEQDAKNIIAQVKSLPELIHSEFETLDMRVRRLLNHNDCLSVKRIMIVEGGRIVADGPRDEILKRITRSRAA